MKITPVGKFMIFIVVLGVAFGIWRLVSGDKGPGGLLGRLAPPAKTKESKVPKKADLPEIDPDENANKGGGDTDVDGKVDGGSLGTVGTALPGTTLGAADKPEVRMLIWAWNAQMGLMYANGGPQATQGSLMAKRGVNLKLIRQDDPAKMQEALVAFATDLSKGNPQPKNGAQFVAIMGDGSAAFLKGTNDTLKRLGTGYTAKVVGTCGYSRGEDKFMGPQAWKTNPEASRGGVVSGYLRDGDWNIAMKWLADNGLPNNPDEKTYDPDALNWVSADSYIDAAEKYITGYTETRDVVRNGRKTGEKKKIVVQATVTWTPGDVNVARKKGGIVNIVSSREYSSQMPNVIIGIDKWMKNNRPTTENYLAAIAEGGDAVTKSEQAFKRAADISAAVYNEEDGAYWAKYFRLQVEKDKTGVPVELGGSKVNNLADSLLLFGMTPGSANLFEATYTTFGDIVVDQYPDLVPNYPAISEVLDTSYLRAIAARAPATVTKKAIAEAAPKPFTPTRGKLKNVISRRAWNIRFDTGRDTFSLSGRKDLERLRRELLVAGGTSVEIHGHTDNVGNPVTNQSLSEKRAFAVKSYLEKKAPVNFPKNRVQVYAHGSQNPIAPNTTEAGRSRNRRVEVVLGTN